MHVKTETFAAKQASRAYNLWKILSPGYDICDIPSSSQN